MNCEIDISNVKIETKRVLLRPFELEDLNDFFEYASVEGVGEMAGWIHHTSLEQTKTILDLFIKHKKVFAVVLKENQKVIGSLGIEAYDEKKLNEFDSWKGREIGYVLSKMYWGKGLIPEALEAVIQYLFEEVKVDFLACSYFNENYQSKRVQEKCGFQFYKQMTYESAVGKKDIHLNILWKKDYENGKL